MGMAVSIPSSEINPDTTTKEIWNAPLRVCFFKDINCDLNIPQKFAIDSFNFLMLEFYMPN